MKFGKHLSISIILLSVFGNIYADNLAASAPVTNNPIATAPQYNYFFHGESLKRSLRNFTVANGLQLNIADDVSANVLNQPISGRFVVNQYSDVVDMLTRQYGFSWFIFSGTLYIANNKLTTASIDVSAQSMRSIKEDLQQVGLLNNKFGYTEIPINNKIIISGPAQYIDLVREQVRQLQIVPNDQQYAVYRLKYASATDVPINLGGQQFVIPGVATILRSLLQGGQQGFLGGGSNSPLLTQAIEPIKNQAQQILSNMQQNNADQSVLLSSNQGGVQQKGSLGSTAVVQADVRYNTVIIRDKPANLAVYKNLIDLLDIPSPIIQVDVLIVHLDDDKLQQSGINWWGSFGGIGTGFGASTLAQTNPTNNLSFYYGQISPGSVLVNNINNFMTALQFLQENSLAQAVGHPSIGTVDNIPAIITFNQTVYLNTPINAGANNNTENTSGSSSSSGSSGSTNYTQANLTTSLQITPHLIFDADGGKPKVRLSIILQDGYASDPAISLYPTINQGGITSQAVVEDGQSILLAGYSHQTQEKVENKIPGLGDIPLLGWFFKSSSVKNQMISTLYLVRPKVIWEKDMYKVNEYNTLFGNSSPGRILQSMTMIESDEAASKALPTTATYTNGQESAEVNAYNKAKAVESASYVGGFTK